MKRIERAVLDRIAGNRRVVSGTDQGLVVGAADSAVQQFTLPWDQIERIVLSARDAYVGESMILVFEARDGTVVQADESMPQWHELVQCVESHLPGAVPYQQWMLDFLSQGRHHKQLQIFDRGDAVPTSTDSSH